MQTENEFGKKSRSKSARVCRKGIPTLTAGTPGVVWRSQSIDPGRCKNFKTCVAKFSPLVIKLIAQLTESLPNVVQRPECGSYLGSTTPR
jgi:hypothetical protein